MHVLLLSLYILAAANYGLGGDSQEEHEKFKELTSSLKKSTKTMVGNERLRALWGYMMSGFIPEGDIVECGVWRGGASMMMVSALQLRNLSRSVWMYDTFEGLPEPSNPKDDPISKQYWKKLQTGSSISSDKFDVEKYAKGVAVDNRVRWNYASLEDVASNMNSTGYPSSKIKFIQGKVEDTLSNIENVPGKIAILRLDTDWYESTKKEFEVLYPKVVPGGLIQIDDYCTWKGSQTATDEWYQEHKEEVMGFEKSKNNKSCLTLIKK
jgi:hypothetical protein